MHTNERAPSTRLHASIAAALLLAATSAARADESLSLSNQTVQNALPGQGNATQQIPSPTGTYYTGTLTGLQVTATACNWSNSYPTSTPCAGIVWPMAGDLAIIIWEPRATPSQPLLAPTVLLQVGGAKKYMPIGTGSSQNFPWIAGSSSAATAAGTCNNILGCAGESPAPSTSPCSPHSNGGGNFNYTNHTSGSSDWGGSGITMKSTTRVMTAWLPADNGNNGQPWPENCEPVLFCSIDIQFTGVTAGTAPPCENPTYRAAGNCSDPCTCSTKNNPTSCGLPVDTVHAVEIRFDNRSGRPASHVKLLPYSCSKSFTTANNPGVLYKDAECTQLLWRDGLFSAFGPRTQAFNGCGHGPGWSDGPCQTVFTGTGPSVPMRTMALSDLHDNGDGTYSLWTNHFPNAIWYIGLPQKTATGWTAVPEVPFYVPWQEGTKYGQSDAMEVAGLQCPWQAFDQQSQTNYFAPASPAAGKGGAPWPIETYGDCEAAGHCLPVSNGVDWQQLEVTLDGSPADIADITYIDFANVPLRLESYGQTGGLFQSTGFSAVGTSATVHPNFRTLVSRMKITFPANLYMSCEGGSPGTVLQAAGPSQNDKTCGNSKFIPITYPAYGTDLPAACSKTVDDFSAVFDRAIQNQMLNHPFPNHPGVQGCAWIRDWLGVPNSSTQFDYDFVLKMHKVEAPDQSSTSYTAVLTGKVTVHFSSTNSVTSNPLTIILGTDTYFTDPTKAPILDLTRAIFLGLTPGGMPVQLQLPSDCTSQSLATLSLRAPTEQVLPCDPRLSENWVDLMDQIAPIGCTSADWFGGNATQNVTALIGRVMGDAYAGFALGFIGSDKSNPIIPAAGLSPWPSYPNTYPPSENSAYTNCTNDAMPFWQTPSGSWWGGNMFPANAVDGSSSYWSQECASSIFSKHYADIAVNNCSIWGAWIHARTEAGYSHPLEDRLKGFNAGINAYKFGSADVTQLRVTIWSGISATSSLLQSDISGDGTVDGYDLNHLLAEWGSCTQVPGGCQSDFDGDGVVDSKDLAEMLASWSSVP